MNYKKIDIITNSEGADIIASFLYDYSESGVVISDYKDLEEAVSNSIYENQDIIVEKNDDVVVTAYIDPKNYEYALEDIRESLNNLDKTAFGKLEIISSDYIEQDYNTLWKSFHKPIELNKIILVPDWQEYSTDKKTLKLSIGSSFGTGQHASTILAIKFLEKLDLNGKVITDLGCGSGVLGLAALIMGAEKAYLCDIEPIEEAISNAKINNLSNRCIIEQKNLIECNSKGDIVVSNIYAPLLADYKDKITSLINSSGVLILSGLYKEGLMTVMESYKQLEIVDVATDGDWSAVMFKSK